MVIVEAAITNINASKEECINGRSYISQQCRVGAVVEDVEHPNIEDEPESAILTEIEREEYLEIKNSDT